MDTRFIETFLMVIDNGSIAEAARRLNLTAAAVAKRIHALESEIGSVLVMRSGRTITPTEAGAAIIGRARRFTLPNSQVFPLSEADRPPPPVRHDGEKCPIAGSGQRYR